MVKTAEGEGLEGKINSSVLDIIQINIWTYVNKDPPPVLSLSIG